MSPGSFLSSHHITGLILSTDGVPVFKGSLWPVYLMVTSIPPHLRAKADNLIVASLWFGQTKPNMNCMLQPILSSIASLEKGVSLQQGSSENITRAKLIMGIFDLPAKAAATNEYGCFYCLDKGRIHNRARIYPPDDHHHLRKPNQMTQWAEEAEQNQVCTFGVKGYSLLSKFLSFPQSIPLDYMHSVLEGVYKQLMKFWFEPRFHSEPYSLVSTFQLSTEYLLD